MKAANFELTLFVALVVLVTTMPVVAADKDWNSVSRLRVGDRVQVTQAAGKITVGRFVSSGATNIVVDEDGRQDAIASGDVTRVVRLRKAHWIRNAIIFGAVGGAVGAGIKLFGVACAETDNGCRDTQLAAFGGVAIGATVGALLPARNETIYQAPRK